MVYKLRGKLPLCAAGALLCAVVLVAFQIYFIKYLHTPYGKGIISPILLYILLWLASVIPLGKLGKWTRENDISYGVYIYAWPISQMIALFGINKLVSLLPYIILTSVGTIIFASLSWFFIERPILSLSRRKISSNNIREAAK
jgi:peptidoglycan/LPS O-acetylase OafA/YrhL